ncbi:MAG: ATP-dependent Clp protease adaptor ClpS [Tepidiformaceae bacterium]
MAMQPSPGTRILEDESTETNLEPPYHLILLDDDHHTYQYVVMMLGAIFGYSRDKGFAIACVVDANGQAIVMTASKDEVSLKQQLIHNFGADPLMENSLGSMSAIIEPALSPG